MNGPAGALETEVRAAVAAVDDPEYPGVSIIDLGLLERIVVSADRVEVGLIPTFSGCPALTMIADDVRESVGAIDGVEEVEVTWLYAPTWSVGRVSESARHRLAADFTVAVHLGPPPACPLCGGNTNELSAFGPSRCRSVHRCTSCGEVIEALRG